jgi:hypothetical protein
LSPQGEFLRTPLESSNAAYRRSRATNPARLFFGDFLLAKQKKVTALSGAYPDMQRRPRPPGRDPAYVRIKNAPQHQ